MICIMNHISRNMDAQISVLESTGREYKIFTDKTNFGRSRVKNLRYVGIITNFINILSHESKDGYKIILQDDVTFSEELFEKIDYVMKYSKNKIVSFYNPTNILYRETNNSKHHVLQTYKNFWMQCCAFPKSLEKEVIEYLKMHIGKCEYSEDRLITMYLCEKNITSNVVVPSLVQHEGFDRSVFGTPAKVGKNYRTS